MQSHFTEEITSLQKHLEQNSKSLIFARLADKYLQMDEIDKAADICKEGIAKHPRYATGHFILARCLYRKKQYDQAETTLKQVLTLDPQFLGAHKLYSDLMNEIGWQKSSEISLMKILEIDPLDKNVRELVETGTKTEVEEPGERALFESEPEDQGFVQQEAAPIEDSLELSAFDESDLLITEEEEEKLEGDFITQNLDQDETRFSEILDDIFSPTLEEEDQREQKEKEIIENAARKEAATFEADIEEESEPEEQESSPLYVSPEIKLETAANVFTPEEEIEETEEEIHLPKEDDIDLKMLEDEAFPPVDLSDMQEEESLATETSMEKESLDDFDSLELDEEADTEDREDFAKFLEELDDYDSGEETLLPEQPLERKEPDEPVAREQEKFEIKEELPKKETRRSEDLEESQDAKEKFVTPTLGEIYAAQGQYSKAVTVFERLLKQNPNEERFRVKLEYLKKKLQEEQN